MITAGTTSTALPAAAREVTEHHVVGAGGARLAVQDHGGPAGAPVILAVHGYPDDHHVWDLVIADLIADYRVFTYDVRGAGGSDRPHDVRSYRLESLVADLDAVVDDVSPERPVHLVGHDWGSIQLWSAVVDEAVNRRFASFTSMSGPGLEHVANWMASRRKLNARSLRTLLRQGASSWYIYAFHTPLAAIAWRRLIAPRWAWMLQRNEHAQVDDAWPGPNLADDAEDGIKLYRANMFRKLRRPGPHATPVPVQLVIPAGDPFVSPALLDGMEAIAPDLVRVPVRGKHWLPRSQPDLVARLVAEHVQRIEQRAGTPAER